MKELKKLIDVKTIVTLSLTAVVCYRAAMGLMDIENLYLMIVAFYFGTQHQKQEVRNGV